MLFQHFVLVLPFMRNEDSHQSALGRYEQSCPARCTEVSVVQGDLVVACGLVPGQAPAGRVLGQEATRRAQ
jgi:hypothetical protein